MKNYAKNPQFLVKPKEDTEVVFSMVQTGGRLPVIDPKTKKPQYFKYPFVETLNYANISVFQLGYGETHLTSFDKNKMKFCSPVKRERENCGNVFLKAGQSYIFVPATE